MQYLTHGLIIFIYLTLIACTTAPIQPPSSTSLYPPQPAYLGIGYEPVSEIKKKISDAPMDSGLQITGILPNSPAERSGLKPRDIILRFNGQSLEKIKFSESAQAFSLYIDQMKAGETLTLQVLRMETVINGERNQQALDITDRDALVEIMRSQQMGETLAFEIKEQWKLLDITATLAPRVIQAPVQLPSNAQLLPQFETSTNPYLNLIETVINDFALRPAYQDLLARYATDELWDDNFRLRYIRYLHRDPLKFPVVAENMTNALLTAGSRTDVDALLMQGADLLDINANLPPDLPYPPDTLDPQAHIVYIQKLLYSALQANIKAFQAITPEERAFLQDNLPQLLQFYTTFSAPESVQAQFPRVFALAHKIDFVALFQSALILNQFSNPQWLARCQQAFSQLPINPALHVANVTGGLLAVVDTVAGKLLIGGADINRYNTDVAMIFDVGGDDFYMGDTGLTGWQRPITAIIDIAGNDEYTATRLGGQGAGVFGTAFLLDRAGDDHYQGIRFVQGAGLMGIGILLDLQGNDSYSGQTYAQGMGLWGYGLLFDLQGNEHYNATLYGQGVGGAKGLGLLLDMQGNDAYIATGGYESSYGTSGIFHGSSQGSGFGFRNNTSGGVGLLVDGQGEDQFKAGNFSQGGGYFFALGILRNAGIENDVYIGSRYGQGFSAHSALGMLMDDGGDDHYQGYKGALQAAAWDLGTAMLIDKAGDDIYDSRDLMFSIAAAAHNGFSLFLDNNGRDQYFFPLEPRVGKNDYHGGASLSFWIDSGGELDQYNGSTEQNNWIGRSGGEFGIQVDLNQDIQAVLHEQQFKTLYYHPITP
ncbi:PDZ domain-containing protein [Beggiatoa leptomitoformis]|uniref:PDZ domain-containing protein n=1 Tax=Beggiatoa leptomitoformis TaxID=288004 RepID=A0A2N9YF71_9GAMM|nr:PDZ domain-containing protein [Beggiatoa leptomitoformis]ALG68536.1 PDZ domain-containing protein [Beggiatoa leptomitoformis]AUI69120.1 PDZ domain-containing protein [Beggiatoa leptomitoformis]